MKNQEKNVEELTIKEAKQKLEEYKKLADLFGKKELPTVAEHPYPVGKNVFIRTVTMAYTGKLLAVYPNELVLSDASWIADTGRFSNFLKTGEAGEVEPFPENAIVPRGAIVDVSEFNHNLPRKVK